MFIWAQLDMGIVGIIGMLIAIVVLNPVCIRFTLLV